MEATLEFKGTAGGRYYRPIEPYCLLAPDEMTLRTTDMDAGPPRANLDEEVRMADWLDQNLRAVTIKFPSLKEGGETAKV